MSRTCTVCSHPEHVKIDEALALRQDSFRHISARYNLASSSIYRHFSEHLSEKLFKAKEAENILRADNLLEKVSQSERELREFINATREALEESGGNGKAGDNGKLKVTTKNVNIGNLLSKLLGQMDRKLELYGKLTNQIVNRHEVSLRYEPVIGIFIMRLEEKLQEYLPKEGVEITQMLIEEVTNGIEQELARKAEY